MTVENTKFNVAWKSSKGVRECCNIAEENASKNESYFMLFAFLLLYSNVSNVSHRASSIIIPKIYSASKSLMVQDGTRTSSSH